MNQSYTVDDCINELSRISNDSKNFIVTRDNFRKESSIPECVWVSYFGTFKEFQRAAALAPSRYENKLINDIAKHASFDKLQKNNNEKMLWEGTYLRPSSKRFQTILVGSDIHDTNCDPFYRRLFLDTAKRVQPEKIILNGDIFDFPEFSKYTVDPREYDVIGRIQWVQEFLGEIRNNCPNSEIILIEGNHEARLIRYISEGSPSLVSILSDLHKIEIKDLLCLDKFEINFYARANLSVFSKSDMKNELNKNFVIINDQFMCHHFPEARNFGIPGVSGHHHKFLTWNFYSPIYGSYSWHQIGCGHKRFASYTEGEKWQNGFLLAHLDTVNKRTQFEPIDCTSEHCFIGGKFYQRSTNEEIRSFQ